MTEQQKKIAAGGAFTLVAALILYFQLRDPSPPVSPVAPVITNSAPPSGAVSNATGGARAKRSSSASVELDPTLRMNAMLLTESLVYSGTGRNIFSAASAPSALPKPIAPARPKVPLTPVVLQPMGPPPPPPIDLKFFGTATSGDGRRQAFLLKGEDVFMASPGEIVQRRYKIVAIAANSIVVEDLANNNRQTLPLLVR